MEPKDKAVSLIELGNSRFEKYRQTRDLQFKVNIALWTLIVLVGSRRELNFDLSGISDYLFFVAILLVVVMGHYFFWLRPLSESMARDNARALDLHKQAENSINGTSDKPERDLEEIRRCYRTINIFLAGITLILLILLGVYFSL